VSKPWYPQNHTLLLTTNYIYLCSLPVPLVVDIYLHHIFNRSFLVEEAIHIPHIYWSFYFFSLNPCFLANSELITMFLYYPIMLPLLLLTYQFSQAQSLLSLLSTCSHYPDCSRICFLLL